MKPAVRFDLRISHVAVMHVTIRPLRSFISSCVYVNNDPYSTCSSTVSATRHAKRAELKLWSPAPLCVAYGWLTAFGRKPHSTQRSLSVKANNALRIAWGEVCYRRLPCCGFVVQLSVQPIARNRTSSQLSENMTSSTKPEVLNV